MQGWLDQSVMKSWAEAQRRLWENLLAAAPGAGVSGPGSEALAAWRELYQENLAVWERSVREALEGQAAWVEDWSRRLQAEGTRHESASEMKRQIEEGLHQWLGTQNRLWEEMFAVLRGPQPSATAPQTAAVEPQAPARSAEAEPAAPVEEQAPVPASASEPPAESAALVVESALPPAVAEAPAVAEESAPAKPATRPRRRTTKPAE